MATTMTGLFVHVPQELMTELKATAKREDRSISAIVRRAILAYIKEKSQCEEATK